MHLSHPIKCIHIHICRPIATNKPSQYVENIEHTQSHTQSHKYMHNYEYVWLSKWLNDQMIVEWVVLNWGVCEHPFALKRDILLSMVLIFVFALRIMKWFQIGQLMLMLPQRVSHATRTSAATWSFLLNMQLFNLLCCRCCCCCCHFEAGGRLAGQMVSDWSIGLHGRST